MSPIHALRSSRTSYTRICVGIVILWIIYTFRNTVSSVKVIETRYPGGLVSYQNLPPNKKRITLISIHSGNQTTPYLPILIQSACLNSDSVDLVLLNIDTGYGCADFSFASSIRNFKHVCLTEEENHHMIVKWVCHGHTHGCNGRQTEMMKTRLNKIAQDAMAKGDIHHNTFKPWRGLIYKEWVETEWWAWYDTNQAIGNLASMVPWDVLDNYDMVISDYATTAPKAIYMNSQFSIMRNNAKMAKVAFDYLPFGNIAHFHYLKGNTELQIEGEYSDLYMNHHLDVNVLRLPDMIGRQPDHWDRRVIIADGHVLNTFRHIERGEIQSYFNRLYEPDAKPYGRQGSTFTPDAIEIPVAPNQTRSGHCSGDIWNPANACIEFRPSYASVSFLMRHNQTWQIRREPRVMTTIPHEWAPAAFMPQATLQFADWKYFQPSGLPNWQETGFQTSAKVRKRKRGDRIPVTEITRDYWATWTMIRGDKSPPRGYEHYHVFNARTPAANHTSDIDDANDWSWKFHNFRTEYETKVKND